MTIGAIKAFVFTGIISALTIASAAGQNPDSLRAAKINPSGALYRSLIIPGWGQFHNKRYIKAAVFAGLEGYLANGIYTFWRDSDRHKKNFQSAWENPEYQAAEFSKFQKSRDRRNLRLWLITATILYSMFDAYVDAQLADFDQPDKAFEVYIGPGRDDRFEISLAFNLP